VSARAQSPWKSRTLLWECKTEQPVWRAAWWFPRKWTYTLTIRANHPSPRYVPERMGKKCPHKVLGTNVRSSCVHHNPTLEATKDHPQGMESKPRYIHGGGSQLPIQRSQLRIQLSHFGDLEHLTRVEARLKRLHTVRSYLHDVLRKTTL